MTEQLQPARKVISSPPPEGRRGQNTESVLFYIRGMKNNICRQLKRIQVDTVIAGGGLEVGGGKGSEMNIKTGSAR